MRGLTEYGDVDLYVGHRVRECNYGLLGYYLGDLSEYINNSSTGTDTSSSDDDGCVILPGFTVKCPEETTSGSEESDY